MSAMYMQAAIILSWVGGDDDRFGTARRHRHEGYDASFLARAVAYRSHALSLSRRTIGYLARVSAAFSSQRRPRPFRSAGPWC